MFKWLIYSYTLVKGYNKGNHGLGHKGDEMALLQRCDYSLVGLVITQQHLFQTGTLYFRHSFLPFQVFNPFCS